MSELYYNLTLETLYKAYIRIHNILFHLQPYSVLLLCNFGCTRPWMPRRLFWSCIQQGLLSSCGVRASCGGSPCCGAQALGLTGSVLVAHGLSCPMTCGIFLDQGMKLCPLHWQMVSLPPDHQGSPLTLFLIICAAIYIII